MTWSSGPSNVRAKVAASASTSLKAVPVKFSITSPSVTTRPPPLTFCAAPTASRSKTTPAVEVEKSIVSEPAAPVKCERSREEADGEDVRARAAGEAGALISQRRVGALGADEQAVLVSVKLASRASMMVSLPKPPTSESTPVPPVRVSSPNPPVSKSAPAPPLRMSLPCVAAMAKPVRLLAGRIDHGGEAIDEIDEVELRDAADDQRRVGRAGAGHDVESCDRAGIHPERADRGERAVVRRVLDE